MDQFQTLWARVRERALNDSDAAYDGEDISIADALDMWEHVLSMKSILTRLPGKVLSVDDFNRMVTAYENAAVALLAAAFFDNGYDADTDVQVADSIAFAVVETFDHVDCRPGSALTLARAPFERLRATAQNAPSAEQFRDAAMVAALLTYAVTKP